MLDKIWFRIILVFAIIGFICVGIVVHEVMMWRTRRVINKDSLERSIKFSEAREKMTTSAKKMIDAIANFIPQETGRIETVDFISCFFVFIFKNENIIREKVSHPGVTIETAGYDVSVRFEIESEKLIIFVKLPSKEDLRFEDESKATDAVREHIHNNWT